jgi:hypothetical protein
MWNMLKPTVIFGTTLYALGAFVFVHEGDATFVETIPYWFAVVGVLLVLRWVHYMKGRAYEFGRYGRGGKRKDGMKTD